MSKSLIELITKAWDNNILFSVVLELTNSCDLNCLFCYTDHSKRGKRLTLQKYLSLLDDARDLGAIYLTLTGGEPTLNKNFLEIGAYARRKGFCIRVKTHAAFHDNGLISRIHNEIDPMWIDISIHGATAEIYEKTTGVQGSFKRFLNNVESIAAIGCKVQLLCPLTTINYSQVKEMIALAKIFNVPIRFDPQITPRNNGDLSTSQYALDIEALKTHYLIVNDLFPVKLDFADTESTDDFRESINSRYCCGAGAGSLTIDPWGNVLPCVAWRTTVGDLWTHSLKKIWLSSDTLTTIRDLNEHAESFRKKNLDKIGTVLYCPGRALQETGTVEKLYDDILRQNTAQNN